MEQDITVSPFRITKYLDILMRTILRIIHTKTSEQLNLHHLKLKPQLEKVQVHLVQTYFQKISITGKINTAPSF
jgi:hypothetical protein